VLRLLDKANEIAALAATVAVKEIFVGVDIEERPGLRVQGTESNELGAVACRPGSPILLPQVIEQRKSLFQLFEILAHGAVLAPGDERRRRRPVFPGKDGGWNRKFLRDAVAREPAEPDSAPIMAKPRDRPERRAPANGLRGRAFGAERKPLVGSGPGRSTSGGGWKDRVPDRDP
jgi:hypothetical protein